MKVVKGLSHVTRLLFVLLFVFAAGTFVFADENPAVFSYKNGQDYFAMTFKDAEGANGQYVYVIEDPYYSDIEFYLDYSLSKDLQLHFSSTNPEVAKVEEYYEDAYTYYEGEQQNEYDSIILSLEKQGITDVICTSDLFSFKISVIFLKPPYIQSDSLKQTGLQSVSMKLSDTNPAYNGYVVSKKRGSLEAAVEQAGIMTGNVEEVTVPIDGFNIRYFFAVQGYVDYHGKRFYFPETPKFGEYEYIDSFDYGVQMQSVARKGSSSLKVTWNPIPEAKSYTLYYSTSDEFGKYKKLTTTTNTSYTQKVTKGVTYYYYVTAAFPNGEVSTRSTRLSGYIPQSASKIKLKLTALEDKILSEVRSGIYDEYGYGGKWNWADSDRIFYYSLKGKNYAVVLLRKPGTTKKWKGQLLIYEIKSNNSVKLVNTIKLPKQFDAWGGFYKGPDNQFYVAYGFNNLKEKDKQQVINVVQYSNKWAKMKTCSIYGSASNLYKGIYKPFEASSCRMTMKGSTLYLFTSRQMYILDDGLRHQSNISFEIDTITMKAMEANDSYVSHSFNQFARFKDNDLVLVDHGDAYPRSVKVTSVKDYRTTNQKKDTKADVLQFLGETGNNYTGATIGGMEVGFGHIIVCGTSVPHKHAVRGVTGNSSSYLQNVYLIVIDRKTGKKSFKWVTKVNPKDKNTWISETRMVKLSDDRFAVLYSVTDKKGEYLYYKVFNDSGKQLLSKKYKNVPFQAQSQPILSKGYIIWLEAVHSSTDYYGVDTKSIRIPALS